jgi:hypothetical protein
MGVVGIALSTGLTGWMQFAMHMRALKGHPAAVFDKNFRRNATWIALSCVIMAIVLFILDNFVFEGLHDFSKMVLLVASGLLVYTLGVFFSGIVSISALKKIIKNKLILWTADDEKDYLKMYPESKIKKIILKYSSVFKSRNSSKKYVFCSKKILHDVLLNHRLYHTFYYQISFLLLQMVYQIVLNIYT